MESIIMQKMSLKLFAILFQIFFCMWLPSFTSCLVAAASNDTDRLALLAFKKGIVEDPIEIMSSWNDSIHLCSWSGVVCSKRHAGRVTALILPGMRLTGQLPPLIGNLSFLREIDLTDNSFRGEIPREIGCLLRLRSLILSKNAFEGKIPINLSNCSNLQFMDLSFNHLVGDISLGFSALSTKKLKCFLVFAINLTGSIPLWLGNAPSLTNLSVANNNFHGSIPSQLGRLSKLIFLNIGKNKLSGTIPPSIYNLSSLISLDVVDNQLHGRIRPDIGFSLPKLQGLYVGTNWFTGPIPTSLSNASSLVDLSFTTNSFTGTMPQNLGSLRNLTRLAFGRNQLELEEPYNFTFLTSLTNCSNLQWVNIGGNKFTGVLPASISNFSSTLEYFVVSRNQIYGTIPEGIGELVGLTVLAISENSMTGKIPAGIGKLRRLKYLYLFDNKLSGAIPSSLGNTTQLSQLSLRNNYLDGNIPSSLGNCQQLELLYLFSNNLTGSIPFEVASLPSMTISFSLGQNYLIGTLPTGVGNMSKLVEFDVSGNMLFGEIPSTISNCVMMERLLMGNNLFEGSIPSTLSALTSLHVLDLSRNNISGQIPVYLQNFSFLENLNLSFNSLEGEVPRQGVFRNSTAFLITGNTKLCGGIPSLQLPACKIQASSKHKASIALKVALPVAISCLIFLLCLCFTLWKTRKTETKISTSLAPDEKFPKISYLELAKATNGFSSSNLIGEGSYGFVYKGSLGMNNIIVAVKVINLKRKGAAKSFMAECNALRNIRHKNLLKVITTCSSIDSNGDDFRALVYEFMPNGSLENFLHRSAVEQLSQDTFSLMCRLSIVIDVASALEYLHHHCQTPIIHGDLKPSNILLDHEMTAHVGDFGLARFHYDSVRGDSSSCQSNTSGIRGTIGYIAPEYGMGGRASMQGDVYAFGILVLELFTGKRPIDDIFTDVMNIHVYTKNVLSNDRVIEIVDPLLLLEVGGQDVDLNNFKRFLVALFKIGVSCSMEFPGERMDMSSVVAELHKIKEKFSSIMD